MKVRIVKDYWKNIASHEDLIKRCFFYLVEKYPHPNGHSEAYSDMLVKMFSLNVFHKFQEARLVFGKKDIQEMKDSGMSDSKIKKKASLIIKKNKINVDKKFERFIYKWIEQVLNNAYSTRYKESKRFLHSERLEEINYQSFLDRRKKEGYTSWKEDEKTKPKKVSSCRRPFTEGRPYPHITEIGNFHSHETYTVEEDYASKELMNLVQGLVDNPKLRSIITHKLEGLSNIDISFMMGKSPAYISYLLKVLKKKCTNLGLVS